MKTVFSHIIQKRYSQSYEDVVTDSLAYILNTHESARKGFMTLIGSIMTDLPELYFQTQVAEGSIRPDIWGYKGSDTILFMENKFWAGLTENQPVSYLHELEKYPHQTLLMMVVPGAREQTMIAELLRKLKESDLEFTKDKTKRDGIVWIIKTAIGPWLALTSWPRLIDILGAFSKNDPIAENDLALLGSLCEAADIDKFIPFNASDLNNQLMPSMILQIIQVIQDVVEIGVREQLMDQEGLTGTSKFEKFGKYIHLGTSNKVGIWFGLNYNLWKDYGISPLWMSFSTTDFGCAYEVGPLLEAWVEDKHFLCTENDGSINLSVKWVFAKTMPEWPHEYILRDRVDEGLFVKFVKHVRKFGYQGNFYNKKITYFDHDCMTYWTMGAPIEETIIINRCRKEDTYEERLKESGLLKNGK